MVKPIFCVGISNIDDEEYKIVNKQLTEYLKDEYYVLVYSFEGKDDDVRFNCFHEKDITETNYEELKEFVKQQIEKK